MLFGIPSYFQMISGGLIIVVLSAFFHFEASKDRSRLDHFEGVIYYVDTTHALSQERHHQNKYWYISMTGYQKTLQLFVGQEAFDFSPDVDKIDQLNVNDSITIYISNRLWGKDEENYFERSVRFIDHKDEVFFARNSSAMKWFASFTLLMGVVMISIGIYLLQQKASKRNDNSP